MTTTKALSVRSALASDAAAISEIYNHYIQHTVITFEETVVTEREIQSRIESLANAGLPWLVVEENNRVQGYAYAAPWRPRASYRLSVEVSVYLDKDFIRPGTGSLLYSHLFQALEYSDVHVAMAGIALPNDASVALHEKFGMTKVGHLAEIGQKFGRWVDVGYWQRIV